MNYKLNNILLSNYGITPGQIKGSNIAVSGIFDLPKRIGQTYQNWDDEDGIEPFVDEDEIFLGGRDIKFYGFINLPKNDAISKINKLKRDVSAYSDLVVFHSDDYGDFNVKVGKIDSEIGKSISSITINMREPQPDLSGGILPATSTDIYTVDRIPLKSFGMFVSKVSGRGDQSEIGNEYFTIYDKEGYQINGRKPVEVRVNGFIQAIDLADFQNKIKGLWKIFTDPGLRKVRLNDYITISSFVTEGFTVNNVIINQGLVIAVIDLKITAIAEYITVYLHADALGKILTTEEGKILVF